MGNLKLGLIDKLSKNLTKLKIRQKLFPFPFFDPTTKNISYNFDY